MDGVFTILNKVRAYLPNCPDEDEKQEFARQGHANLDTEMSSMGNAMAKPGGAEDGGEGSEGYQRQTSFGGEGGVGQEGDMEGKVNGSISGFDDDDGEPKGGVSEFGTKGQISEWQAGWNVTNAIQGMFIVSLPMAVKNGGYLGVFAMVFVAGVCYHTGKILVECLYEINEQGEKVRVRDSYVAIAQHVLGKKYGGKLVNCAQIIELLMTCILYVVLCGDLMFGMFPGGTLDNRSWMMMAGMVLLPCAFLRNLAAVSMMSFWCSMVHLAINIIIIGYCLTQAGTWAWNKVRWRIDVYNFPISLGIVVFSYTSQIFLPSLEGHLKDRSRFNCMLKWSHVAAAAFKAIFAYVAFLTFSDRTEEEVTNNMPGAFQVLINFILVIKAMLSYPLPFYAAIELLEIAWFRGQPQTALPSCYALDGELKIWGLGLRLGLVFFTVLMAVFIPHFATLMGLIGSFTGTMLSLIWPSYFHLRIKWDYLEWYIISFNVFIMCLGLFCGLNGIYYSFRDLVEKFHLQQLQA